MQVRNISISVVFFLFLASGFGLFAQQNQTDQQGRKQGNWVKYKDGVKAYEGQFVDDKPNGEFVRFYTSGRLMSKTFFSEMGKRGLAEFYYDDRKQTLKAKGLYIDQLKDSLWLMYNEQGVLISEEYYHLNIPHGIWKLYSYLGALVKETPYTEGKVNGVQKEYFEDGTLKRSISFEMDTIQGLFQVFYPDGKIRNEGMFNQNMQDGDWNFYQEDGTLLFIESYEDGVMIKRVDPQGNPFNIEIPQDTTRIDVELEELELD